MKVIYFLVFLTTSFNIFASCSPSSCTPACESSCTYKTCTQIATVSVTVEELPYIIGDTTGDSCEFETDNLTELPFTVGGSTYTQIPVTINKEYKKCEVKTNTGGACPP